jgi:predicted MFS family arabinose efflux permease
MCANQTSYGFNYFYPSIVEGFNLGSRTITLACTAPPYIVAALISYGLAWSSDRRKERGFHIIIPVLIAIIGFIVSVAILSIPARYVASFLFVAGVFAANPVVFSWAASTANDTPQKKACAMAIINLSGQFGNIWSPYFFDDNDAPRYSRAMVLLMVFSALEVTLCCLMKWLLSRENRKLVRQGQSTGVDLNLYTL